MSPFIPRIASFLNNIGIKTIQHEVPYLSVLSNVHILEGNIIYNDKVQASELLHEAGHIAIVPAKYRGHCSGDIDESMNKIYDKARDAGEIVVDGQMYRALIQCSDTEATAWAWAVGKHLNIPENQIIQDHEYDKGGEGIRFMLLMKAHVGINGLIAAGMVASVKSYPSLLRWTQL